MGRRRIAGAALLIMTAAAFGYDDSVSGEAPRQAELSGSIEIWDIQPSSKDVQAEYEAIIEKFEAEHPGTEIVVNTFPGGPYRDTLLVAVQGGTGPDIMSLDQIWTAEFAEAGLISPIDDYLADSTVNRDDFFPGGWDSNVYEDQTWGIPLNFDVWAQLYYNADIFREAGLDPDSPPTTWDEWIAVAEQLHNPPEQVGIALIGSKDEGSVVVSNMLMYSNGGSVADGSEVLYDSPENIAALEFYTRLAQYASSGVAGMDNGAAVSLFSSGAAAMLINGSWQQDTMRSTVDFDWRIATPPAPEGGSFAGVLGGWNLAISEESDNPDLAFAFLEYMAQAENQTAVNSLIPGLREAGQAFVEANRTDPDIVLETLEAGRPRALSPVYPQISAAQQDAVQEMLGGTDVSEAVADAADEMRSIFEENE